MALELGTRFGPYEVAEPIGSGGMGEVYRARDTELKRDVALKVLPPAFVEDGDRLARFRREAEILASLNHPNIAQVHGLEKANGQTAIVMELVEGATLADRIEQGPIPLSEALEIATQIADALEAAHERGIVHRDLKPANTKLRPDGTIKVLDFGVAKAVDASDTISGDQTPPLATPTMTAMGVILGTAGYMSPEQARGKPVDRRADIWSFGCVLYEMLTGQPAFAGEDVTVTLARILERESDLGHLPAETPPAVRRTLELCLQKDLRKRIRDIGDVKLALRGAFASGAADADAPDSAVLARVRGQARFWMAATVVSLLIAATAYFYDSNELASAPGSQHLVLDFPREGTSEGLYFQYRLSPDGRYAAVSGVVGETFGIFVRALDSLEWRLVAGDMGSDSFWSTDGSSLNFLVNGQVLRVPVDGGPVLEVADIGVDISAGSGTINQNGVIVVSPGSTGGLYLVSDEGREISQLTTTEPFEGHRYPYFLPDGDHFLYTARGGSREGIFLASLDDPSGRRLLADPSSAIYAPPKPGERAGHLIFERDGQLLAQRFDAATLELEGPAGVIVGKVVPQDNGAAAVSVSSTGLLLYRSGRHQSTDSRLISVSREGEILETLTDPGVPARVALSPNERQIALVRGRPGLAVGDVSILDLARGQENPLTFDGRVPTISNAVWAPDGQRIAYSLVDNEQQYSIVTDDPDGPSNPTVLLINSDPVVVTDWTEGGVLVYTEYDNVTSDIYYLQLDDDGGPAGQPIAFRADRFQTSFGDVSPDGNWIAYSSDESGIEEIWLESFPTGSRRWRLTDTRARAQQPRWNRAGTELYFQSGAGGNQTMMVIPVSLAMIDDGTAFAEAEPLFRHGVNGFNPRFGVLFFDKADDAERFVVDALDMSLDEASLNVITNWQQLFAPEQ